MSVKNRNISIIKNHQEIYVLGLENEFIQVILNIINNSIDAFETNNNLDKFIFINMYKENNTAILTIKDNAGGIKNENLDRIFEPYFTTKHKSQGTGVGLYMSLQIVTKHLNGEISVKNDTFIHNNIKYFGAKFTILIPIYLKK